MSELAEGEARASVPEAMTRNLSGFFFIDVGWVVWLGCLVGLFGWVVWLGCLVGLFGWVVDRRHGPVAKLATKLFGLSAMVSIQTIWSMEIRAN